MLFREARTPPSTWTQPKILKRKEPRTGDGAGFFLYQLSGRQLLDAQSLNEERQALTRPRLARLQQLRGDGLNLFGGG